MKRNFLFGVITFLIGWIFNIVYLYLTPPAQASPHWLLLFVLALGGLGYINLAQTLGFLWGLCLDIYGMSLFGLQGWLLALIGFISGKVSRQLDASKLGTQEALSFFGTIFFLIGYYQLELLFNWPQKPHQSPFGTILIQFLFNALAVPVVFWIVRSWLDLWVIFEGRKGLVRD